MNTTPKLFREADSGYGSERISGSTDKDEIPAATAEQILQKNVGGLIRHSVRELVIAAMEEYSALSSSAVQEAEKPEEKWITEADAMRMIEMADETSIEAYRDEIDELKEEIAELRAEKPAGGELQVTKSQILNGFHAWKVKQPTIELYHSDIWEAAIGWLQSQQPVDPEALTIADYEESIASTQALVREIDVIINGENAAKQASLCDLIGQIKELAEPAPSAGVSKESALNYFERHKMTSRGSDYLDRNDFEQFALMLPSSGEPTKTNR